LGVPGCDLPAFGLELWFGFDLPGIEPRVLRNVVYRAFAAETGVLIEVDVA